MQASRSCSVGDIMSKAELPRFLQLSSALKEFVTVEGTQPPHYVSRIGLRISSFPQSEAGGRSETCSKRHRSHCVRRTGDCDSLLSRRFARFGWAAIGAGRLHAL